MQSTVQSISSNFMNTTTNTPSAALLYDPNFIKYRQCFKNSLRELELLLKEISTKQTSSASSSGSGSGQPPREDRIHGHLLIILEILKFSGLEFEKQIEKYLSKYNIYHQQMQQAANNTCSSDINAANSATNTSK
jgi:hypothetical protein